MLIIIMAKVNGEAVADVSESIGRKSITTRDPAGINFSCKTGREYTKFFFKNLIYSLLHH